MSRVQVLALVCLSGVLGCLWAATSGVAAPPWPDCSPRFKVTEQVYEGRTVYWLRRRGGPTWPPLCSYFLDSPALFHDMESARAAAARRLEKPWIGDEHVVATVP